MTNELKDSIKPYLDSYLNRLDQELILFNEKTTKNASVGQNLDESKIAEPEVEMTAMAFHDFFNILRQVHQKLYGDETGSSYKLPTSKLLSTFGDVLQFPKEPPEIRNIFDKG